MTDPYRIPDAPAEPRPASPASARRGAVRSLLWLVLVISLAGDVVASTADLVVVGSGFGLVALGCVVGLVVQHVRRRRS
jgi:hypothetical protein